MNLPTGDQWLQLIGLLLALGIAWRGLKWEWGNRKERKPPPNDQDPAA
jgi:hypothetical protein